MILKFNMVQLTWKMCQKKLMQECLELKMLQVIRSNLRRFKSLLMMEPLILRLLNNRLKMLNLKSMVVKCMMFLIQMLNKLLDNFHQQNLSTNLRIQLKSHPLLTRKKVKCSSTKKPTWTRKTLPNMSSENVPPLKDLLKTSPKKIQKNLFMISIENK